MKNSVQKGDTLTAVAPTGGVISGMLVVIGSMALIPVTSAAEGELFEGVTVGVYELPKKSTDTPTAFSKAFWDAGNSELTTTATDNTLVGVFIDAYGSGETTAMVRLNGVSVTAEAGDNL